MRSVIAGFGSTLPPRGASLLDAAAERGAKLHVLDVPTDTTASAPALARLADAHDVDLVHAYGGWDLRPAFLGPCRWGRRPLVQTEYEMYVSSQTYPHQPLIVGTGYLLDEQRDVHRGQVDLISPPVDLRTDTPTHDPREFMTAFDLDPTHCRIVIVSRLATAMKEVGIRDTIEAIEALGRDHVDLLIVGSGDAEHRLRAVGDRVNDRLGRQAVTFCGALHDPRGAYAAADVVVGMGSSAARALAFGKPLVVSGERGWYRTFAPDSAPLLFRNSFWSLDVDTDARDLLAQQLRALVDDAARREDLGAYGRRFAEEHFGLELMAQRLVDTYDRALSGHRRTRWFADLAAEARPGVAWLRRRLRSSDRTVPAEAERAAC